MPVTTEPPELFTPGLNGHARTNPALGGRDVPARKPRRSTAAEQGRRHGGKPYSKERRQPVPTRLEEMARLGCRVQVTRRQKRSGAGEIHVRYTRGCTDDERANYAWRNEDLQLEILVDLRKNLERFLKEARRQPNPGLDRLVQAMADAWALTMQRYGHLLTPLTAWSYWDATLRPAVSALGLASNEPEELPMVVQRNTIGEVEEVLDVINDIQVADAILIWFGRDTMNILLDAPVDVPALLVEPGSFLLTGEQEKWVRDHMDTGDAGYPATDSESTRVAAQYGINPASAANLWELLEMVRHATPDQARSNPAANVRHPAKWRKAEQIVEEQYGSEAPEHYGLVRHIYERMGGRYNRSVPNPARDVSLENEAAFLPLEDLRVLHERAEDAKFDANAIPFLDAMEDADGDPSRLPIGMRRRRQLIVQKVEAKLQETPGAVWRKGSPTKLGWKALLWGINVLPETNYRSLLSRPVTGRML